MANNCLVTKLKGVVDNNNLPFLNEFRLVVRASSNNLVKNNCIKITVSKPTVIRSVNGVSCIRMLSSSSELETPTTNYSYSEVYTINPVAPAISFANLNSIIIIEERENIVKLELPDGAAITSNVYMPDVSQLSYDSNLTALSAYIPGDGVIDFSENLVLNKISCRNVFAFQNWGVDIDTIPANTYTAFRILGMQATKGNVASFISRVFAAGNTIPSIIEVMYTKCTGRIENIFASLNANGVSTLTLGTTNGITANNTSCKNREFTLTIESGVGTLTNISGTSHVWGKYNISSGTWSKWSPQ